MAQKKQFDLRRPHTALKLSRTFIYAQQTHFLKPKSTMVIARSKIPRQLFRLTYIVYNHLQLTMEKHGMRENLARVAPSPYTCLLNQ